MAAENDVVHPVQAGKSSRAVLFRQDSTEFFKQRIQLVHLCASKAVRDQRRIDRAKPSTKASRDQVDDICPEDTTLQDNQQGYRYIKIQNDGLSVDQTVEAIKSAIPELYAVT